VISAIYGEMPNFGMTEFYTTTSSYAILKLFLYCQVVVRGWTFGILGKIVVCPCTSTFIALSYAETQLRTYEKVSHQSFSLTSKSHASIDGNMDIVHMALVGVCAIFFCFSPALAREIYFCLNGAYGSKLFFASVAKADTKFLTIAHYLLYLG
jgi:hypothetical protein